MVEYDRSNLASIVLQMRGSVLPRLWRKVLIGIVLGLVAAWVNQTYKFYIPLLVHQLVGIVLGLLLVFRTNASYDRYWEGRRLVGGVVNRTRDLARQAASYLPKDKAVEVQRLIVVYYAFFLRALRQDRGLDGVKQLADDERKKLEERTHRAPLVLRWMSDLLAIEANEGRLTEARLQMMDGNIQSISDSFGGCERILKTPVPFAYAQHIKIFTVLYCYSVPFALAKDLEWKTWIATAIMGIALFGVDEIGVEIEEPFGTDPNDLPMEAIGEGIAKATAELVHKD